jgi:amino acid adenylation domain-containing protein
MSTELTSTEAAGIEALGAQASEGGAVAAAYRMSPQQRELWARQTAADGAPLATQCVARVRGPLSADAVREAARACVARHEALRTGLVRRAGAKVPAQVIREAGEAAFREESLRGLDSSEQACRVAAVTLEEENTRFDYDGDALLRLTLLSLSDEEHVLILTAPSLIADGRSLLNIVEEIGRLCSTGRAHEACDGPVQYIQFSEWQNELQEGEEAEEGRRFWQEQLGASPATMRLPLSSKLVNAAAYVGDTAGDADEGRAQAFVRVELDAELARGLGETARELGVTVDALLRACWQAVMSRLTGREELVVAVLCDGRQYEQLSGAVGLFARYLPSASGAASSLTLAGVAREAAALAESAADWQDYFIGEEAAGGAAYQPAVGYAFETCACACAPGWSVEYLRSRLARFALCLRAGEGEGGVLSATVEYSQGACTRGEAARVAEYFARVARQACETRGAVGVGELELLSEGERDLLLRGWNETSKEYERVAGVVELFERAAAECGVRVAVECEGRALTYAQLNARANQLARRLRVMGVGPDVPVAICLERSIEMVVTLLGVLKAGGAYVPLDPAYSKERLAFMLEDVRTPVVLTQESLAAALPAHHAQVICLDSGWGALSGEGVENLPGAAAPENLAYVLFTSGSTGKPKGVAVEHRQLLNYVRGVSDKLALPPHSSFATISTFAADLGNTVIFPSLCSGGRLHVIAQERATDPEALADYFERHEIDCLKIVPSHLEALQKAGRPENIMPRRRLVLGGESSRRDWVEGLRRLAPDCRILNHYGPTETTVGVLTYEVEGGDAEPHAQTLPLGRPLANSRAYVLDARLSPVPAGVAGELYVGGRGVARGYLGRPALTAERFIPDPFSGEEGSRLYRTGDLCRYAADGLIEFLGREDGQVKIRGFRIETGEIEAALRGHAGVREAVVLARDDEQGHKRLVAYVTGEQPHTLSAGELQVFLREKLPEYMVPSEFVLLKSLPLNPNGKLDRQALPELSGTSLQVERVYVAPRTPVEEVLAGIWADVLKVERVGVVDNFFALGGHSLVAMQIMSRVRNVFRVDLPLRVVFEGTTVEKLARGVIAHEARPGQSEKIALVVKKMQGMSAEEKLALLRERGAAGG